MSDFARGVGGVVLLVVALPLALIFFAAGHIVTGWDSADNQCASLPGSPPVPIEVHGESGMTENGEFMVFPFGVACVFEEPGDGIAPQPVLYPNWPATTLWVGASSVCVLAVAMMITGALGVVRGRDPNVVEAGDSPG